MFFEEPVKVVEPDMVSAYRKAYVVVCRAGATSCAELTALGVPSILIPFPQAAHDHQTLNARDLEDEGAALLLAQDNLGSELADQLEKLLGDRKRRDQVAASAKEMGRLDAASEIAAASVRGFGGGA